MQILNISNNNVDVIEIYQFHIGRILKNHTAMFYGDTLFRDLQEEAYLVSPSISKFSSPNILLLDDYRHHKYLASFDLDGIIRKIAVPFVGSQEAINMHLTHNHECLHISDIRDMFFNGLIYGKNEEQLDERQAEWCEIINDTFSEIKNEFQYMNEFTKDLFMNNKPFRLAMINRTTNRSKTNSQI